MGYFQYVAGIIVVELYSFVTMGCWFERDNLHLILS